MILTEEDLLEEFRELEMQVQGRRLGHVPIKFADRPPMGFAPRTLAPGKYEGELRDVREAGWVLGLCYLEGAWYERGRFHTRGES